MIKVTKTCFILTAVIFSVLFAFDNTHAFTPLPVEQDPLVRMPGTQPPPEMGVSIEGPGRCLNCHANYDSAVEPGFNWKGSMMAQAARDFLFLAGVTVAAQDSIWATGTHNAADICLRCATFQRDG